MSNWPKPDAATLLEIYRKATLIKQNDEHVIKQMMAGKLVMPYYSPRGQEIIPSAISVSLDDDDYICTIYRGIHDMLAKGFPLDELWAELAGKVTGTCKGKGGPMHLTCPEKGMMVTTGIVGSSMPIATGLGWAAKLDGRNRVSVANFGDGATNIGAFHESMNMAAVWKLPVIFLCQNNHYAEHTAPEYSRAIDRISDRAAAYGMPGVTVDGNDPDEMYGAAKVAIERARAGEGPTLIEAMTFRFNGHILGEAGHYMDKDIYANAQAKDPMPVLRARLLSEGIATEADLAEIEQDADSRIVAAIEAAMAADFPDVAELKRDVFAEEIA
ncbi:thiamine pyrophosphate-dependent dehydrogenase E1 component subunit alpha [Sphingomonadales bacterium 56]|uniref:Thiamine pyrophosphate-dependent dehydrogenase E1 component subunit alpha n=1 Tax=Sphingobium agri TaxID=2933566 RepID=A0ABT0DSQ0_9SPHN|nr:MULTISPECIES: thiamine pyrophosphate-dependent dehydrogenase E1 component subunit alpha [Sphingobium]MBY2930473.1 thiamine pyrophosphate-dependent dehydrogenase E1 component subunit alpha [Sphingomonadales bacterium 56]MBY2960513.1 thiamine pyrophosphate-dependent dehydrogenase E1 component subunit alpha [Sphingomonadales bacterium 58]MCK0530054.1 thiamine pyrophosphate-dependent dehydrogenase E1 component subunit alpha [Sphingobium agri]CAD7341353.1 Acetoin:2,6-dichlorophenolindophenol oxid